MIINDEGFQKWMAVDEVSTCLHMINYINIFGYLCEDTITEGLFEPADQRDRTR